MRSKAKLVGKMAQHRLVRMVPSRGSRKEWAYTVICNGYPKAGTNLLIGAIEKIHNDRRRLGDYQLNGDVCDVVEQVKRSGPGRIISAHEYYSEDFRTLLSETYLRHFLIVRDLRDIAVSTVFYLLKDKSHRLHKVFVSMKNFRERLMAVICGIPSEHLSGQRPSNSIFEHARGYLPFTVDNRVRLIRFEDLVGENGGGSRSTQLTALAGIVDHLGGEFSEEMIDAVANSLFGSNSRTFRSGQLGAWRKEFDSLHIEAFQSTGAAEMNSKLGYLD